MATLSMLFLGPLEVALGGEPVRGFKSDKVRALLVYLAVEADRPHSRESLAALLWPEIPDRAARNNLRDALSNLRQVINDSAADPPFLLVDRHKIQLNVSSDHYADVTSFRVLVRDRHEPDCHKLEEAVSLYRAEFLEGFGLKDCIAFEDWCLLTRERLQRQALLAMHQLALFYEGQNDFQSASRYAWRYVELAPWEEDAQRLLMRLLALNGQRGAALTQYEACCQSLQDELGVDPAPETVQLFEQIRDGAPVMPAQQAVTALAGQRATRPLADCPYRGLAAFREQDAPFYFGREKFARELFRAVHQHAIVTVIVGSSGSGKSSLVAAGLLPLLRDEGNWLVAPLRPGRRPFNALAGALMPYLEQDLSETDALLERQKLAQVLYSGELSLYQVVERIVEKHGEENRLILVGDQFEELFTLCQDPTTRTRFLDRLMAAAASAKESAAPSLVILLSLRADFMNQALAHRPFADTLQDASLMLGPMTREELRAAIEVPAKKQGAEFEPGLVNRILTDVGQEPGNLPLLEFALTLLWGQADSGWITHEAYDAIGRVDGAVAHYADDVYAALDPAQRESARQVFLQLVRPGQGTEDSRRVATRSEIGEQNWSLAQLLADCRLVVTGLDDFGVQTAEIVHEALIIGWDRLQSWLKADRAFRTWQEGLRAALRQWQLSDHDDGALLRGVSLAQAENWLAERGPELSVEEQEFINTSIALRESKQAARERRRQRTLLALAGGLLVTLVLAIVAFGARASAEREAAVNHSLVLSANAEEAFENGYTDLALALALEATKLDEPPPEALRVLSSVALGPGTRTVLRDSGEPVRAVAFSPDVQRALTGSCLAFDPAGKCAEGELLLWNLDDSVQVVPEPRHLSAHHDWITAISFSPDGKTALSGSADGALILWDVNTGQPIQHLKGHTGGVNSVTFVPSTSAGSNQTALSASEDQTLIVWDLVTGEPLRRFEEHTSPVHALAISNESPEDISGPIIISSSETELLLWDLATGDAIRQLDDHQETSSIMLLPDGNAMIAAQGHALRLWDLASGQIVNETIFPASPDGLVPAVDGRQLLFALDADLRLWDIESWQQVHRLLGQNGNASSALASSADGHIALSGAADGSIRLWNIAGQSEIGRFPTDGVPLIALDISPDGDQLLTGDMTDQAVLWSVPQQEVVRRLQGQAGAVSPGAVALSPDGSHALVGSGDVFGDPTVSDLVLWDVETGDDVHHFEGNMPLVRSVAFSPDGRTALGGSESMFDLEGDLILWDLESGEPIRHFDTTEDITSIVFSADGDRALTASAYFNNLTLWDVATGKAIRQFEGHEGPVFASAFGPDETTAISASEDGTLIQWDLESGAVIRRFVGHDGGVWSLDISPDGQKLLSSSEDGTVILWDMGSGRILSRYRGHTLWVPDVVFGPDGQDAFSVSYDGTLIQWRVTERSLDELREWIQANRYVGDLTCDERQQYRIEPPC